MSASFDIAETGDSSRVLKEDFAVRMQQIEARNKEIQSSREYRRRR
jgi:hypothetical protein